MELSLMRRILLAQQPKEMSVGAGAIGKKRMVETERTKLW